MRSTKEQILDAAECLFSEHGIEAVPLRRVIAEAGVNSAAIHYHFGSKEELVRAVFRRRFDPINRERIQLLDEAEERAPEAAPSLEEILYAIVAPPFLTDHARGEGAQFRRLAGRLFTERLGYMEVIINDLFAEVEMRFDASLRRALPDIPENERSWRKYMAMGSMVFVMREQQWIQKASGGACDAEADVNGTIDRLVYFMAAGLCAPLRARSHCHEGVEPVERSSN
jgi:AcrR family transcriptional regulator